MPTAAQLKTDADKYQLAGRADRAIPRYQQARDLYLNAGDESAATECLHQMAVAQVFADDENTGISNLKKALKISQKQGQQVNVGRIQRDLGIASMVYRHYFYALEYLEASRATLSGSAVFAEQGITEAKLGRLYALEGEYKQVDGCFEAAFELIGKEEHHPYLLAAIIDNAFASLETSQWEDLEVHLEAAWSLLQQMGEIELQRRRVAQICNFRIRLAINTDGWFKAMTVYKHELSEILAEFSPACAATLKYELKLDDIAEALNM